MRKIFALMAIALLVATGCATQGIKDSRDIQASQLMREQASASETAALNFFKLGGLGGFQKSAELFKEAAESYRKTGDKASEQRALVASTKAWLWGNDRQKFLTQTAQVKELLGRNNIPVKDVRFLINLADKMEGRELSYPLEVGQEELFD